LSIRCDLPPPHCVHVDLRQNRQFAEEEAIATRLKIVAVGENCPDRLPADLWV
jgi:hypothetical protein